MVRKLKKKDLVVISKEKAFWTEIVNSGKVQLANSEKQVKLHSAILAMAEKELANCKD